MNREDAQYLLDKYVTSLHLYVKTNADKHKHEYEFHRNTLLAALTAPDKRVSELEAELAEVKAARVLTCVYCGHEYPQSTPASGSEILTEHIRVCEKHPMRALESELAEMQKRLHDQIVKSAEYRDKLHEELLAENTRLKRELEEERKQAQSREDYLEGILT